MHNSLLRLHQTALLTILALLLTACWDDKSGETTDNSTSTATGIQTRAKPFTPSQQSCKPNQVSADIKDIYYPGPKCEHVARNLDSQRFLKKHIQICQKKTGVSLSSGPVASVSISSCKPAENQRGIVYSKQICCNAPAVVAAAPASAPRTFAYKANLSCPDNRLQAMATNLHFPDKTCAQAARGFAEKGYESSHYQKACQIAADSTGFRQTISDAALFTCNQDETGAYLDVALCCSATLPPGKKLHPLTLPKDIWEILTTRNLFALQLMLSIEPERAQERGKSNITPLHRATSVAMVDALLSKKALRDAKDKDGNTPLHSAVRRGQHDIAARLLQRGANVNAVSRYGDTALSYAKSRKIAALLLDNKANPNGASPLVTPLHVAAFYGRTDVVDLLTQHGADINRKNRAGETPLHRAAFGFSKTSIDVVRLLISKGSDINTLSNSTPARTPLDMAKKDEMINLILSHGGKSARELLN